MGLEKTYAGSERSCISVPFSHHDDSLGEEVVRSQRAQRSVVALNQQEIAAVPHERLLELAHQLRMFVTDHVQPEEERAGV